MAGRAACRFRPVDWWDHKFIFSYDHERQVNDPNEDGFVGPTRALFERTTVDYQNDLRPASWLTLTSRIFLQPGERGTGTAFRFAGFGPQPTFISDHTDETGGFSAGERDADRRIESRRRRTFRSFQSIRRYLDLSFRRQLSDRPDRHDVAREVATGFSPPSSQDKIFGNNFDPRSGEESRIRRGNRAAFLEDV